ncbi:hypothetical protein [Aeromonas caviae]|uniref:hypothetical protein n=1 Tax=Aeromonas caviae TaxID=648 RepID=UPI0038CF903D
MLPTIISFFKTYLPAVLKYCAATIFPVFLGSFILAGALVKYGNSDALNKAIMETAYKPSKEKFRECSRAHNRLFIAEQELSGSYLAMEEELQFVISNGNKPLPPEYAFLVEGLSKNLQALNDEIAKIQKELPVCYDTLYSQLEDLGLLLGVSEQVRTEFTSRAKEFNDLHRARTEKVKKAIERIDPRIIQRGFRGGFETLLTTQPNFVLNGLKLLASHAQGLSESDKRLFELEQSAYQRVNSITTTEIQSRLSKGIWAFLLS